MMSTTDLKSKALSGLKIMNDTLKILVGKVDSVEGRVDVIQPETFLNPATKPGNYQEKYGCDPNMAAMFRKLVSE